MDEKGDLRIGEQREEEEEESDGAVVVSSSFLVSRCRDGDCRVIGNGTGQTSRCAAKEK